MSDIDDTHMTALADDALPVGTSLLDGQFTITGHLGAGGFGKTYRAEDNILGRTVVIKECFPEDYCTRDGLDVVARTEAHVAPFESTVNMFVREARSLAKLRHPNIVGVHRAFEENQTAYMALDLIDGDELFGFLDTKQQTLTPYRVKEILLQLLGAIEKVHDLDLLHRDISPDNIIIEKDGTPVLIDFGAARGDASRRTRAMSSMLVVKDGYSPQEFYVPGAAQTPSCDLYALAATFYHVLSGDVPPHSQTRMVEAAGRRPDPCIPLEGRIEGYDKAFLQASDKAMQIHPGDRIQSAAEWRSMITATGRVETAEDIANTIMAENELSPRMIETLARLVEETNKEVRKSQKIEAQAKAKEKPKPAPKQNFVKQNVRPAWVDEFNREGREIEQKAAEEAAAAAAAKAAAEAAAKAAEAEARAAAAKEALREEADEGTKSGKRPLQTFETPEQLNAPARSLGKLLSFGKQKTVANSSDDPNGKPPPKGPKSMPLAS